MFDVLGQTHPCDTTTVVLDQTNTDLIADCKVLWGLKNNFRGTGTTNWNASTLISNWTGITVGGTHQRVTRFGFSQQMGGTLPPELGQLSNLLLLQITDSRLTGSIPPELGQLSNLQELWLYGNRLTGSIPPELGQLSSLTQLYLNENSLTGVIPSELADLSSLTQLLLSNNQLSGEFPLWVENLGSLTDFSIQGNLLTGHLPLEYPFPSSVTSATIGGGGMWIGCVPGWATSNSAVLGEEDLALPSCGTPPGESVWVLDTALAPPSPPLTARPPRR